ncbi:MAG: hypothetical protein IJ493_10675 [Clostridia bacterium]|nr:hypothetical protein [Clostridia bacterium]
MQNSPRPQRSVPPQNQQRPNPPVPYIQRIQPSARPRIQTEQLRPIRPDSRQVQPCLPMQQQYQATRQMPRLRTDSPRKKKRFNRWVLHDFLLGLIAGLVIFGTASVFVCKAVIAIFL